MQTSVIPAGAAASDSSGSAVAVFVFFAAAAGAGVVGVDLFVSAALGLSDSGVVLVGAGGLGDFLALYFLLDLDVEEDADGLLHNVAGHFIEHVVAGHLVFHKGIVLAVGLQADALAELFHVVDVVHPLAVDDLEDNDRTASGSGNSASLDS